MTDPDPHPDSLPADNHDSHSDVEQATSGTNRDITNVVEDNGGVTPDQPDAVDGSVAGTGGVTDAEDSQS